MFTVRVLDLVAIVLLCARRRVPRAVRLALLGVSVWVVWYQNPVACTCIRLPLLRCDSTLPWRAVLRSELRNLASQQEIYRLDHGAYSADPVALAFVSSDGVEVRIEAGSDAWSATASHVRLDEGESCRVVVESGDPGRGEVVCRMPSRLSFRRSRP